MAENGHRAGFGFRVKNLETNRFRSRSRRTLSLRCRSWILSRRIWFRSQFFWLRPPLVCAGTEVQELTPAGVSAFQQPRSRARSGYFYLDQESEQ